MGNTESGPTIEESTISVVGGDKDRTAVGGSGGGLLSASKKRQQQQQPFSSRPQASNVLGDDDDDDNNKYNGGSGNYKNRATFQPPSMKMKQDDSRQPIDQYSRQQNENLRQIRWQQELDGADKVDGGPISPPPFHTRYEPTAQFLAGIDSMYSAGSIIDDGKCNNNQSKPNDRYGQDDMAAATRLEAEKLLSKIAALGTDVLEASAAVFHYLEHQDDPKNNNTNVTMNGGKRNDDDDDMSMSGRSHAVLTYVTNEARRGNVKEAYKFLETVKTVKEVLQEDDDEDNNGDEKDKRLTNLMSPTNGMDRYAHLGAYYGGGGMGGREDPIVLNDDYHNNHGDNDDNQSISDESMALFRILESLDGGEGTFQLRSPMSKQQQQQQQVSNKTVSPPPEPVSRDPPGEGKRDVFELLPSGWYGALSPKSQPTVKASGGGKGGGDGAPTKGGRLSERYLPDIIPEMKSTAEETDPGDMADDDIDLELNGVHLNSRNFDDGTNNNKNDYPIIRPIGGTNQQGTGLGQGSSGVDITDLPHLHMIDSDMDLEFVANFDVAFNEFIARHPVFLERFPDLVHHLRISKLQKLLEHNELKERSSMTKLTNLQKEKTDMEENMQLQLRDAARKKAARQTLLQSELNNLSWSTKRVQTQLRWKFVQYSVDRAKRQTKLRRQFKSIPHAENRHDLSKLIPNTPEGQAIRESIRPIEHVDTNDPSKPFAFFVGDQQRLQQDEDERQIREYQLKNKGLNEEIALLNKRLAYLQMDGKKFTWVESILLRIDETTMIRLKTRFQKKEGIAN